MKLQQAIALALVSVSAGALAQTGVPSGVFVRGESVPEGNTGVTPLRFQIIRAPGTPSPASVTYRYTTKDGTATAGSDYAAKTGTVTLSATAPTAEVLIDVNGDTTQEENERLSLELRDENAPAASPVVAMGSAAIINDDGVTPPPGATGFFVTSEGVREGNSGLTDVRFRVSKSNPASTGNMTLNFATSDETATAGSDYEAQTGTVTLTAAQPSAVITVKVMGDTTVEPNESFKLSVSDPILAIPPQIGKGFIFNDDGLNPPPPPPNNSNAVIVFDAFAIEPSTGETEARIGARLLRPATTEVVVNFAATSGATATAGSDYTGPATGSLTFAPGETLKQITFQVKADAVAEGREFVRYGFTTTAVGVTLPRDQASLTIVDRPDVPPPPVQTPTAILIPCRPFVAEDAGNARLLVKRVGSTEAALGIRYATQDGTALSGSDYTATSGDLNWAAGNAEIKTVNVEIIDDTIAEQPERFKVQLQNAAGDALPGRSTAPIVILDSMDTIFTEDFSALCTADTELENSSVVNE
jgi:large repetitive protein